MAMRWYWFGEQSGRAKNPDELLRRAQEEMRNVHSRNRERAVQAITDKNNLEIQVNDWQKRIGELRTEANAAELRNDFEEAARLRNEIMTCECERLKVQARLDEARAVAEQVKSAIRQEEERIRRKTAEALALQAQWRTLEVERSLMQFLTEINISERDILPLDAVAARHRHNRNAALRAMAARNTLRQMYSDTQHTVAQLQDKTRTARQNNNEALERQFLREMELYEANRDNIRTALERAEAVAERARTLVQEEAAWLDEHNIPVPPDEDVILNGPPADSTPTPPLGTPLSADNRRLIWPLALAIFLLLLLLLLLGQIR